MKDAQTIFVVIFGIVALVILYFAIVSKKETFTNGSDAPIARCIQKCEMSMLQKNPYFVHLQEGRRMTNSYCRQMCAAEYNRIQGGSAATCNCEIRKSDCPRFRRGCF